MADEREVLFEFDVNMSTGILYDYLLKHTYSGLQGILATVIGCLLIMNFAAGSSLLYLIAGIIVIVYIPGSLYLSAKRQMLLTPAFKKPLHYRFLEEGIEVSQDDIVELQNWKDMQKAVSTGKSIIVYTSKVKAAIFPRKDMGEQTVRVMEIICTHMAPDKVKIKQ
ncbi:MAG: YcxB family protein [Lachnospiraceae bacterium]|nr:YcxB family protein [Lachnospiraceae bacterium]